MKVFLVLGHSQNPKREITSFEDVMWGTTPSKPGRLPMAIFEMAKSPDSVIVFSGGTEFKKKNEADEMKNCLYKNLKKINKFRAFFGENLDIKKIEKDLEKRLILEKKAQTTFQNFQYSLDLLKEKKIEVDEIVVITSYDHLVKAIIFAFEWREKSCSSVRINFIPGYTSRFPSGVSGLTLIDQKGKGRISSILLKLFSMSSSKFADKLKETDEGFLEQNEKIMKDILRQL